MSTTNTHNSTVNTHKSTTNTHKIQQIHIRVQQYKQEKYGFKKIHVMKTKKVLFIVSNIFSHHIAHTFLSQTFDFHHFTTHIYPHYT